MCKIRKLNETNRSVVDCRIVDEQVSNDTEEDFRFKILLSRIFYRY